MALSPDLIVRPLLASLLLPLLSVGGFAAPWRAASASDLVAEASGEPSVSSREALQGFLRQLDRAEDLYNALMFEEADRLSELTVMRINAFLESHRHLSGVDEIEAVLQARTRQLRDLRALKEVDRMLEEQQAADRYDRLSPERLRRQRERQEQAYRLAVELRRAAEARAARWWPLWYGRPLILVR